MASSSASSASAAQSTYALTTTFTPAAPTCTQSYWTLLGPAKSYFIYLNYPEPIPQSTFGQCYPSQFLSSYLAQQSVTTPLPAIQPLICPIGYASMSIANAPDGYLACCPSSMGLALSTPTQSGRPAFGGTCYTAITSITVTAYGDQSVTATSLWTTPAAIGAQAYALPIEGYAYVTAQSSSSSQASSTAQPIASVQSSASSQTSSSSQSSSSSVGAGAASTSSASVSKSTSSNHTGAIVGGVIGGLALLALLALGIFFCLRRRRNKTTRDANAAAALEQHADGNGNWENGAYGTYYGGSNNGTHKVPEMMSVTSDPVHEVAGHAPIRRKPLERAELSGDSYTNGPSTMTVGENSSTAVSSDR